MRFVAVTSCPTGIAHSQMAAENLEQTAERLGHDIKVEVQGAMGQENELSADDIAAADAAIIAADTSVSQDRFEGMALVKGTVKDAVNDAEGLIEQAIDEAGGDDGGAADADAAATPDETVETAEPDETAAAEATAGRDGDQSEGLFARLKQLFS
ncbi:PTS fructose transporter subunit IIB [Salinilacihabitans rarus]|uniref:PTS fructose transporter subunit IIB n=1 Tax=Salinilacihabitans rarus TaxID=2961596 RepID=UPI0020C895E2|nr:PTS fructose transporter subunit IIB [Salinilacihabitans rarus]